MMLFWLLFAAIALLALAYYRASLRTCCVVLGVAVLFYGVFGSSVLLFTLLSLAWALGFLPLVAAPLRQEWLSRPALGWFRRALRQLDADTLAALDAGSAWWEAELLDGEPDWERFQSFPPARPLLPEQVQIEALAAGCLQRADDASAARVWLRGQRGYGLGIPIQHRGLGFSAAARSTVLARLAAAVPGLAGEIADPARLAWIELLLRHGSEAQQERWLPTLADGAAVATVGEAPAGEAVAFLSRRGEDSVVALRLRLDAAAAAGAGPGSALGLLLEIRDPDKLLGGQSGPSCVLLSGDEPGLKLEAGVWRAADCTVELEAVVGGLSRIGSGNRDWTECLAVAQAIAAPALHAGLVATAAAAAGAQARIHAPFAESPGQRAVAQEALALIGAHAAAAQALAATTALAVDLGERPQGLASFARSLIAEQAAQTAAALADLGAGALGAEVLRGSGKPPARLTRPERYTASVLRGHAAFMQALEAARQPSAAQGLEQFDAALWGHVGHIASAGVRSLLMGLTAGSFSYAAGNTDLVRGYCRRINRYSAALAFAADLALTRLGADLASHRPSTARRAARAAARLTLTTWLGDAAAHLWLASCALKHYEDEGAPPAQSAPLDWTCAHALRAVEEALDKVLRHLSMPALSWLARILIFPRGHGALAPSDHANRLVAQWLQDEDRVRRGLAACGPRLAPLAAAFEATLNGEAVEKRAAAAPRSGSAALRIADAAAAGVINAEQTRQLEAWLETVRRLDGREQS
jgi:acyl-CoA dehydrogenase